MQITAVLVTVGTVLLSANLANADLAGHWKLDESSGSKATDSSGNSRHGVLRGDPVWQPLDGRVGGALRFDGADDYVSTPFVLDPGAGPFSAFAWIKGGAAGETLISQADGTGFGRTWLGTTGPQGVLTTTLSDGGRFTSLLASELAIADGLWHHVGLVWDGSRRHLYVDGVEVAKDANILRQLYGCNGGLYFGTAKTFEQTGFWSGLIDDIQIYNSALSASQVEELFRSSKKSSIKDTVSVVALAPKTLYAGSTGTVSLTAVNIADRSPAAVPVTVSLRTNPSSATKLFEGITDGEGRLTGWFDVPGVEPGTYTLQIQTQGVEDLMTAQVQVQCMPVILIETDKPIYKPGQTMHGRVLILTNNLRPTASSEVSVEITDGKGVKIFRKSLTSNAFGVAPFELDLANELNFGTWKITAKSGSASGSVDVRVEKYVLPRFDVDLLMERDYFIVSEKIAGTIKAGYFFGKPVEGTVKIKASRYVGLWEEYASYTATLSDGSAEFILPEVGYVSGTPGAGGGGSVQLEVTVTDTSDHEEKTIKLLKIVDSTIQCQLIASSQSLTPGQLFEVLLVAETPDGQPVTATGEVTCQYFDKNYQNLSEQKQSAIAVNGSALVALTAPEHTAWAQLHGSVRSQNADAQTDLVIYAAYSPTDSFLHLRRASDEPVKVGDTVIIDVFRTHEATIYYDVFAKGHTVWSDAATGSQIVFQATQQMVPAAKVVAYIINPNNEISADTLPLEVVIDDAAELTVEFDADKVLPGEPVHVSVQAQTEAMVGLAIVDESVYALNEGRLNMQEVFNELERRFMEPQVETHESPSTYGAYEVFKQAGVQVLVSGAVDLPQGQQVWGGWGPPWFVREGGGWVPAPAVGPVDGKANGGASLAEVTYIRQYFPETWLWLPDLLTLPDGTATVDLTAPDSITTWRLHAVSTSQQGLGITESALLVFQEFFGEPDLPYAVTRGEQFPVRIQVFNYLDEPQTVQVELAEADWFKLLDDAQKQVSVNPNSVSSVSFLIEPAKLGRNILEVTLRSPLRADAVRKEMLVEAEGTRRELITNGLIKAGETLQLDANMPPYSVEGSEKLLLSITPSLVAQSINGVDDLLQMPYGCGEQNMIFFAPDVEVLRYLNATGQLTPEVRAKAEHFITVGYQRELTFRHNDGSFSAFGESDQTGSLWLTAFVLDCFSAARDIQTIDETVLAEAAHWIETHQLADGSWEPIGFVCHSEMVGGVKGTYALTAFVTIALADYGAATPQVLTKATQYLASNVSAVRDDAYALAIAALAFARLGNTAAAEAAIDRLMEIAIRDDNGIHWEPHAVETTAYAALAMIEMEKAQANDAIKWLALQRNSLGGFGSTQDTVMALKALMTAARAQSRNVNLTITAKAAGKGVVAQFNVDSSNFDVLQIAELPVGSDIELSATGTGEARFQLVRIFNVFLRDDCISRDMTLEVTYDADHVEIDDIVNVTATVRYFGLEGTTGMMIVDVGVPTGFSPVEESLAALVDAKTVSRFEIAGRKVILYVDGLAPGEKRTFTFQVKARFPVRAVVPDSKAYLYYQPQIRAECAGPKITAGAAMCTVDLAYLARFAGAWLETGATSQMDLDNNGSVDFKDFSLFAGRWLGACTQP
jgi:CD109 antigen